MAVAVAVLEGSEPATATPAQGHGKNGEVSQWTGGTVNKLPDFGQSSGNCEPVGAHWPATTEMQLRSVTRPVALEWVPPGLPHQASKGWV